MTKSISTIFFVLFLSILIFQPLTTQAGLVDCELEDAGPGGPGKVCDFCEAVRLISRIIHLLLFDILTPLTIIAFLFAGGYYLFGGENPGNIKKAHGIFRVAIYGILITFTGWLIVNTIIAQFVNSDSEFGLWLPWNDIPPCSAEGTAVIPVAVAPQITETQTTAPEGMVSANRGRALLQIGGVDVNRTNECKTLQDTGCTSIGGLPEKAITNSIDIKANCNCNVEITGGADGPGSHSPNTLHKQGNAVVDYAYDKNLGDYLKANQQKLGITKICTAAGDETYRTQNCANYNEATRHFHVEYGTNN